MSLPRVIAVTGLRTFTGRGLIERLLARDPAPEIIAVDRDVPRALDGRVRFRPIDLTDPTADARLGEVLDKERCEALIHAAFRDDREGDLEEARELEVIGSLHVMSAAAAARVRKLIVVSSAEVYGARPDNPGYLTEESPLRPHPDAQPWVDRAEVESLLSVFASRHPDICMTSLRPSWVVGPRIDSESLRRLTLARTRTPLGFDPLVQFLHEDDWLDAVELALRRDARGAFNLASPEPRPLSTLMRLAGRKSSPRPRTLLRALGAVGWLTGDPPDTWYDYLRYPWLVDWKRARIELGFQPVYSTKEAWLSVFVSRRMREYA